MIQTTLDAIKGTNLEVFVKCHPSTTESELDYWKNNVQTDKNVFLIACWKVYFRTFQHLCLTMGR